MNRTWHKTILFALSFSFLLTPILFAQNKPQPVQRWEYKTISCNDTDLGKSGDEGWELVTTRTDTGGCYQYLLKRLKPANAPKYIDPQAAPPKKEETPTCKLTAAQAPTIRGLHLGMTVDELIELFPGANPNDLKGRVEQAKSYPSFGQSVYSFRGTQHKDRFENVSFDVSLFDRRVRSFNIGYPFNNYTGTGFIYNREQLLEKLNTSFSLPADMKWQGDGYPQIQLVCQDLTLKVNYQNSLYITVEDRPKFFDEILKQRQEEDKAKKRTEFKP